MRKYKARHRLSDHLYIAEVEIDGKGYMVLVGEDEDGKPVRWEIFEEKEK